MIDGRFCTAASRAVRRMCRRQEAARAGWRQARARHDQGKTTGPSAITSTTMATKATASSITPYRIIAVIGMNPEL